MVEKVKTATEEYRQESDVIAQFLVECTIEHKTAKVKASDLYETYKKWCTENGEDPISGTAFGRRMKEKGYDKEKARYVHYIGIGFVDSLETIASQN
jgi:putative DNA primase/helicase